MEKLIEETVQLPEALTVIEQTKEMIAEVESLLPDSPNPNFRERLVGHLEKGGFEEEFERKAKKLIGVFDKQFGVSDF